MANWNAVRTGKRGLGNRTSGVSGFISNSRFEAGDTYHYVIPIFERDGVKQPFFKSFSVHNALKKSVGILHFNTSKGKVFKPFSVRTAHPYGQSDYADYLAVAEKGIICPLSELAYLQNLALWKAVEEKFGKREGELTATQKKELGDFIKSYKAEHFVVDEAYYKNKEGETVPSLENYVLVMKLETKPREEKNALGIVKTVHDVVLDDKGFPKYSLEFLKVSKNRLDAIVGAVNNALADELLTVDNLFPYTDFEGTENEVTNIFGWVQLMFHYPEGDRNYSGRNLEIKAVRERDTSITKEFVENFTSEKADEVWEKAEKSFFNANSGMKLYTRDEMIDAFAPEVMALWTRLREEFKSEALEWENKLQEILNGINNPKENNTTPLAEVKEDSVEEVVETSTADEGDSEVSQTSKDETDAILNDLLGDLV